VKKGVTVIVAIVGFPVEFIVWKPAIFPVPFGSLTKLGWIPSSLSLSVGSLQRISTTNYYSTDETSWMTSRGLLIYSTYSKLTRVLPIPPCKHTILSSITAAKGNQSKKSLIFYDRFIYPVSTILDKILFKRVIGKNLFLFAEN
jgi:hypothetical protein